MENKNRSLKLTKRISSGIKNPQFFNNKIMQEWLSTEEAAEYLKKSVSEIHNLCSAGKIPYYKLGRSNRYRRDDLDQLLLQNRRGGLDGKKS